jgi:hypothetical protein
MSDNRDRAELSFDEHLHKVLAYMQRNIPTHKLIGIADAIQKSARLLWQQYPQEPVLAAVLCEPSISCETRPNAIVSVRVPDCAGGDSVVAMCGQKH